MIIELASDHRPQHRARAGAADRARPTVRGRAAQRREVPLRRRGDELARRRCRATPNGILSYHNAGKVQASSQPQDMRLQRMLGHLTTLVPANPQSVLVVACGAGVTAGAASIDPRVENLTIAEIEPLVPSVVAKYFGDHNFNVVKNPKVHVEVDDARHFLNTTKEKFDAITSDPFDPWVKGAANAVHQGVLGAGQGAPQPGRRRHRLRPALRQRHGRREERDRDVLRSVPERHRLGQHRPGRGLRHRAARDRSSPTKIDVDAMEQQLASPEFARGGAIAAPDRVRLGDGAAVDLRRPRRGAGPLADRTRRSTATRTCACSSWPASA